MYYRNLFISVVVSILLLLMVTNVLSAIEYPPGLSEKMTTKEAEALTKYLFHSKIKMEYRPIMEEIKDDIKKRLETDNGNPVLWFLYGRVQAQLNSIHMKDMQNRNVPREEAINDEKFNKRKADTIDSYKKALSLDDNKKSFMHLNNDMLKCMYYYIFSPADVEVVALRKELERLENKVEEYPPGVEDYEWTRFSKIVTAYVDEHRYDDAIAVLEEMKEKFPYPTTLKDIEDAIRRTEERKAKEMQEAKAVEDNQVAESKPQQVQKSVDKPQAQKVIPEPTQPPQKQPKMISEQKPQQPDTNKAPLISPTLVMTIVIMAAVILGAFIYLRRKKQ